MTRVDSAMLIIRLIVGLVMVAHGLNHAFGGGRIPGAARWFESMGLRPGRPHAIMSTVFELASGLGILAGFLTPLACAAAVGQMVVAGVVVHRPNGFFIFKEGYEYVLMIGLVAVAIAAASPGYASIDHVIGLSGWAGWWGGLTAAVLGVAGAAVMLATSWRPVRPATD
jgi:putative oxidoreductase